MVLFPLTFDEYLGMKRFFGKAIHQDEDSLGDDFKAFVARLREARADGVVTPEESVSLVRMMDTLLAQDS